MVCPPGFHSLLTRAEAPQVLAPGLAHFAARLSLDVNQLPGCAKLNSGLQE